jgi:cysteine desulfurase/selenocysteine lyase
MEATREAVNSRATAPARAPFDVERVREDFPILQEVVHGKPLVYLDNAATSQKPLAVLEAMEHFYRHECSNVHRGVHLLSERATRAYEGARMKVREFIGAAEDREIVFVRGTTEALNLVAWSYGRANVGRGDEVLITTMEHHSNIVPWQMLCEEKGARLRVAPINDAGELLMDEFEKLLSPQTKVVSVAHVSNALGTVNPVKEIARLARRAGAAVVVDGAQAAPHLRLNVRELDCDFYALSGHKLFGPTGIGVLYGKAGLLEVMPPYQGGGDMISSVTFERTTYNVIPFKFEAGTPYIAGAIGLGAAIDYLEKLGLENVAQYEHDLLNYATERIARVPGVRLIGTAREKAGVISFEMEGIHPHDVGTVLDREGVAIRTGHHCAQPVMQRFGVAATARASFSFYNTREDVDRLVQGLEKAREFFS